MNKRYALPRTSNVQLRTPYALGRALGVPEKSAVKLIRSGLANQVLGTKDDLSYVDEKGRALITQSGLEALASVPTVPLPPRRALNVRIGPATEVDNPHRDVMGWHYRMSESDLDLSVAGDYGRPSRDVVGWDFVATIAGFVVAHGLIRDVTESREGFAFDVDWSDPDVRAAWHGVRIRTKRGGPIEYLIP